MNAYQQKGLSLIELSVAMLALGAVAMLAVKLLPATREAVRESEVAPRVVSTHAALEGFAFVHARLPWADADGDGHEDEDTTIGLLPYVDLGLGAPLRNASDYDFLYAVYVRPDSADPRLDTALTVRRDRLHPYLAAGLPPTGAPRALGVANSLDLCQALGTAQDQTFSTDHVHIASSTAQEHVAYLLVDPGTADRDADGSLFDGRNSPNAATRTAFEHPTSPISASNDDRVHVRYFNELRERMGCTGVIAASGHAHPNVETTLAIFRQAARDYREQLKVVKEMASADVLGGASDVAAAASGIASASASLTVAIAATMNSYGAKSGAVAVATAGVAAAAGGAVFAAMALAEKVEIEDEVEDRLDELDDLIDNQLDPLYDSVRNNVRAQDALGVFDDQHP
ncbi:hypothetical protein MARPU_14150 [Marichromatium purpuratum 984]|uniref:Prepilin-type N-terminal cleavage/methylation domain-containing protein n=1 Tax=Marichromatium purpuratum 984 TaxID=765910 RepID=W0E986_MARPU|nr:prepilin-type N-terminal cleavage/methylation domain-containing protein [Marichromatium purpuratum]AHF05621.1 hypothetical protein MARPU_14150 [Marichromatium purpuratum 984]